MRAFPGTPPPKRAPTFTVMVGVDVVALHFSAMFPVVPTSAGMFGAAMVPVTLIVVEGTVTTDVQFAPTSASGSETID